MLKVTYSHKSVTLYRVTFEIENGMSSTRNVEYAIFRMADWHIKDAKFVDDDDLILVTSQTGEWSGMSFVEPGKLIHEGSLL